MFVRFLSVCALAGAFASAVVPAWADSTGDAWNHSADQKMTQAPDFTIAPILPIPIGTLQIAKLSNGAKLVPFGSYLDLHDRKGTIVARFDPSGRTLEPPDRPINIAVTDSSVVFLGPKNSTRMTLPRPHH